MNPKSSQGAGRADQACAGEIAAPINMGRRERPAGLPVWSPHSGLSESRERGRGVWWFRRGNGRGRGGARTSRRSRAGDRRYRLGRYRLRRRRFWHWRCCHSTPLTRGAAGNPRRCLADHAGVLGDASWDEIRWPAPTRGRAMTRLRLHQTVRFSARSRQRSLPATRAVCLPSGALPAPLPAARLRVAPAGHHRGDDGDAHGGAGGEHAADGGAGRRGARPWAVRQRPRSRTARARFRHPGRGTLAASGASRRTTSRGRHEQSAIIEPARRPADDLVPVSGHPPFQPGVTRVLFRGRPYAGPVRAPVSADAGQVQGLHALAGLRRGVVPECCRPRWRPHRSRQCRAV